MKPMLACDWKEQKVVFPVMAQPKIDGVRGLHLTGTFTGRSLKQHRNIATTRFFSHEAFTGLDGELAAEHECHSALCRLTSSAVGTISGSPFIVWHVFDYLGAAMQYESTEYARRYELLRSRVEFIQSQYPVFAPHIRVVPSFMCANMKQLLELDEHFLDKGYEGTILRDPNGLYKHGRCTVREGGLLRIKRFIEDEARVDALEEGEHNNNEQQVNELGRTFRSSHQENKVPNGMVGAFLCTDLKTGDKIRVSPGSSSHAERTEWFRNPSLIVGKIITYKHFPKGVKDKPRMAGYVCIRDEANMGGD